MTHGLSFRPLKLKDSHSSKFNADGAAALLLPKMLRKALGEWHRPDIDQNEAETRTFRRSSQWIGLRENLQETHGFLPSNIGVSG